MSVQDIILQMAATEEDSLITISNAFNAALANRLSIVVFEATSNTGNIIFDAKTYLWQTYVHPSYNFQLSDNSAHMDIHTYPVQCIYSKFIIDRFFFDKLIKNAKENNYQCVKLKNTMYMCDLLKKNDDTTWTNIFPNYEEFKIKVHKCKEDMKNTLYDV
jgi:23S rRNA G2445 N2-methylase RlmL